MPRGGREDGINYEKLIFFAVVFVLLAPKSLTNALIARASDNASNVGAQVGVAEPAPTTTVPPTLPPDFYLPDGFGGAPPATTAPAVVVPVDTSPPSAVALAPEAPATAGGGEPALSDAALLTIAALVVVAIVAVVVVLRKRRDPKRLFDRSDKAAILARWGDRCAYRGLTWVRFTGRPMGCSGGIEFDHIDPHAGGGRTDPDNGQPTCERHNGEKTDLPPWQYAAFKTTPVVGLVVWAYRKAKANS